MPYTILNAEMDRDRDLIIALWNRNFEKSPKGRYDWIYKNNPYGRPTTFLLKDENSGKIVGSYSLFPRKISIQGKYVHGYICGDLVVDTQHRSLGPAMTLIKAALKRSEEEEAVLFGFPNDLSGPVLVLTGFKDIAPRFLLTKILRAGYLVKRYANNSFISKLVSYPYDRFLLFRHGKPARNMPKKYEFEVLAGFDKRFDDYNDRVIDNYTLKGEINSKYYNWRFGQSPYKKSNIYTMKTRSDGSLVGYIVFSEKDNKVSILDMSVNSKEDEALNILMSSFHAYQYKNGNEAISTYFAGDGSLMDQLLECGFHVRSQGLKTILYLPQNRKEMLNDILGGRWYLSAGDNDV